MHVRSIVQTTKGGSKRFYTQIVRSVRRPDGMPATEVVAHLGPTDPVLYANLKEAFSAARREVFLEPRQERGVAKQGTRRFMAITVRENLVYLPIAVVSMFFRQLGLDAVLGRLETTRGRAAKLSAVVEALIAHRCVDPGSKLAFQRWLGKTAITEVVGVADAALNNTRVHRALDELAQVGSTLQEEVAAKVVALGSPRVLYLDLTDTWFDEGGGSLARRAPTKAGHRSKRKIHIALLVNEKGLPMRWCLLPGALCETTVLPGWIEDLNERAWSHGAVLIFDRGMSCVENLSTLVGTGELGDGGGGRLFLTSVKSDLLPTCIRLDAALLDALQALRDEAPSAEVEEACGALGLEHLEGETYAKDLGVRKPPASRARDGLSLPPMRMYLYFNREIQRAKRDGRQEKIERVFHFVAELNHELRSAKKPRKAEPTQRKVTRLLEKLELLELVAVTLRPFDIVGRTKPISSYQVDLEVRQDMLRNAGRHDGLTLLVGHPKLQMGTSEAIAAYRQKNVIEADFCIIKSVLRLRPTFHWTDAKIQSHVTICILALLVERLIEIKLTHSSFPTASAPHSAHVLLEELAAVHLNRLHVNGVDYSSRTQAHPRVETLVRSLGAQSILDVYPETIEVPIPTP